MKHEPRTLTIICSFHASSVQPSGSWQAAGISVAEPSLAPSRQPPAAGCGQPGVLVPAGSSPCSSCSAAEGSQGDPQPQPQPQPWGSSQIGATSVPREAKQVCVLLRRRTISLPAWCPWLHRGTGQAPCGKAAPTSLSFFLTHLPFSTEHPHSQVAADLKG